MIRQNAGQFDKTVMLRSFTEAAAGSLGHRAKTFADVRKCAARLWEKSAAERSTDPAEFGTDTLRLLLYRPPSTTAIGWHIVYSGTTYEILDQESRDAETTLLVTLQPVRAS